MHGTRLGQSQQVLAMERSMRYDCVDYPDHVSPSGPQYTLHFLLSSPSHSGSADRCLPAFGADLLHYCGHPLECVLHLCAGGKAWLQQTGASMPDGWV